MWRTAFLEAQAQWDAGSADGVLRVLSARWKDDAAATAAAEEQKLQQQQQDDEEEEEEEERVARVAASELGAAAALRAGRPAVAVALLEGEVLPARPLDADVWVLRGKALLASGHARAACAAFARASELAPLRRDAAVALRVARAAHFRQYWELAVAALPFGADAVAVRDLAERGRGRAVVAAAQFDAGDTLFVETPLVLQTLVAGGEAARSDRPRGCAVCLRRGLADADLARLGVASLRGELYREHSPAGDVPCAAGCDVERYCSEACRRRRGARGAGQGDGGASSGQ